jgi:hypothetical protein
MCGSFQGWGAEPQVKGRLARDHPNHLEVGKLEMIMQSDYYNFTLTQYHERNNISEMLLRTP